LGGDEGRDACEGGLSIKVSNKFPDCKRSMKEKVKDVGTIESDIRYV
jgi:hypothetical protein